jgi:hypothetical protein
MARKRSLASEDGERSDPFLPSEATGVPQMIRLARSVGSRGRAPTSTNFTVPMRLALAAVVFIFAAVVVAALIASAV